MVSRASNALGTRSPMDQIRQWFPKKCIAATNQLLCSAMVAMGTNQDQCANTTCIPPRRSWSLRLYGRWVCCYQWCWDRLGVQRLHLPWLSLHSKSDRRTSSKTIKVDWKKSKTGKSWLQGDWNVVLSLETIACSVEKESTKNWAW